MISFFELARLLQGVRFCKEVVAMARAEEVLSCSLPIRRGYEAFVFDARLSYLSLLTPELLIVVEAV